MLGFADSTQPTAIGDRTDPNPAYPRPWLRFIPDFWRYSRSEVFGIPSSCNEFL